MNCHSFFFLPPFFCIITDVDAVVNMPVIYLGCVCVRQREAKWKLTCSGCCNLRINLCSNGFSSPSPPPTICPHGEDKKKRHELSCTDHFCNPSVLKCCGYLFKTVLCRFLGLRVEGVSGRKGSSISPRLLSHSNGSGRGGLVEWLSGSVQLCGTAGSPRFSLSSRKGPLC